MALGMAPGVGKVWWGVDGCQGKAEGAGRGHAEVPPSGRSVGAACPGAPAGAGRRAAAAPWVAKAEERRGGSIWWASWAASGAVALLVRSGQTGGLSLAVLGGKGYGEEPLAALLSMGGVCWCSTLISLVPLLLALISTADAAISARTPAYGARKVSPLTPRFCAVATAVFMMVCLVKVPELCSHALRDMVSLGEEQPAVRASPPPSSASSAPSRPFDMTSSLWDGIEPGRFPGIKARKSASKANATSEASLGDLIERETSLLNCAGSCKDQSRGTGKQSRRAIVEGVREDSA